MLCSFRSFKQIIGPTLRTVHNRRLFTHKRAQRCVKTWPAVFKAMSYRFMFRDFNVKIWSLWTRNSVNSVFRRCRRERCVKDVIQCFKQAFFKPRRTLLFSATAAFKTRDDDTADCDKDITDEDLEGLLTELEVVEELSRRTLFCKECGHRLVIGQRCRGVRYCACKDAPTNGECPDGWVPYMEAEDVIIWRKEYKHGQGMYAYKVYGRYKDVRACDFALVQTDAAYRRAWDVAVAALALVEDHVNGVKDQAVLHWEVLWPRLFANRDYVYIRRHKEFQLITRSGSIKDTLLVDKTEEPDEPEYEDRPSVHSNAKRKAREAERRLSKGESEKEVENKVYVIVSRSCEHPKVPETKHAIRVNEYWSHMVVKTLDGADKMGMEFVLTYYDEPAVGGLPSGVAAWATGRAAPAYLDRMRKAALDYRRWISERGQILPEVVPLVTEKISEEEDTQAEYEQQVSEENMESSKQGPDLNGSSTVKVAPTESERATRDASTQTESDSPVAPALVAKVKVTAEKAVDTSESEKSGDKKPHDPAPEEERNEKNTEDEEKGSGSWWRYLYPFYYFV